MKKIRIIINLDTYHNEFRYISKCENIALFAGKVPHQCTNGTCQLMKWMCDLFQKKEVHL